MAICACGEGGFQLEQDDTVCLLKECDSGSKMAVSTIDEVLDKVSSTGMKQILNESKDHHAKLGNEIHQELSKHHCDEKDPNPMAKSMAWMKTNMKMGIDESDATAADLITDGCDMGTKSLHKYLNKYQNADHTSKDLCHRLVSIEEELRKDLRCYL